MGEIATWLWVKTYEVPFWNDSYPSVAFFEEFLGVQADFDPHGRSSLTFCFRKEMEKHQKELTKNNQKDCPNPRKSHPKTKRRPIETC